MSANHPDNENIWLAADTFRNSAEMSGYNIPAIDVLFIVDVVLKFDVINIPDLFTDLRMDDFGEFRKRSPVLWTESFTFQV